MYNGEYWLDGRYNNEDYKVQEGTIGSTEDEKYVAYKVYPASITHTLSLAATEHHIYYYFDEITDYTIYIFNKTGQVFDVYH
jgi:hypothetical protein